MVKSLHAHQSQWRQPAAAAARRCPIAEQTFERAPLWRSPKACFERFEAAPALPRSNPHHETYLEVSEKDVLDVAQQLLAQYQVEKRGGGFVSPSVAVLNLADGTAPSSDLLFGIDSAEIELCRRSCLFADLAEVDYPLKSRVVFSRDVVVFRGNRSECYAIKNDTFPVCILSAAAPDLSSVGSGHTETMRERIDTVLAVFAARAQTILVLGTWECAAGSPIGSAEIARLYRVALGSQRFRGWFRHIVFVAPEHSATSQTAAADFRTELERRSQPFP